MTRNDIKRMQNRQWAAVGFALAALTVLPIAVLLVMLYTAGMLSLFGDNNTHQQIFGWLSHKQIVDGHTHWEMNKVPLYWLYAVLNVYLAYQIGEGLFQTGRAFARRLATA